ncbi:MAG: Nif3-like dinuclear metal center hexameric protein [Legionella sp.]
MISTDELVTYLNSYLSSECFNDYAPNGLQIQGAQTIKTICTAVSASYQAIIAASQLQADALLVHHGFFWRGEKQVITGIKYQRISSLINHNMNLIAYHLPLDCHPDVGNNACLAKILGVNDIKMHAVSQTPNLLWTGMFSRDISAQSLQKRLSDQLNRQALHINGHNRAIRKIAWCSGAAQDFISDAMELGADAYISGEISERTYYEAQELGIHYYACGHHATERYGIQALGEHLGHLFDLQHHYLDSNNLI